MRMRARPGPEEGHHILSATLKQPHISVIVDKPITFMPGTALFTLRVGPVEKNWTPYGYNKFPNRRTSLINTNPALLDLARPSLSINPDAAVTPEASNQNTTSVAATEGNPQVMYWYNA